MRHMETGCAAKQFDRGLQKNDCGGSIDIVIAVEEDGLIPRNSYFKTLDGWLHSQHQKWVVEVRHFRVQEDECFGGGTDTACDQEFCKH